MRPPGGDIERLRRLSELARMARDADLAKLSQLGAERDEIRARVATLSRPAELVTDPAILAVAQAHRAWALRQRIALNQRLAAQTARWLVQRDKARRSFGRDQAVSALLAKAFKGVTKHPRDF